MNNNTIKAINRIKPSINSYQFDTKTGKTKVVQQAIYSVKDIRKLCKLLLKETK